jgi:hypothetical protein
MGKILNQYREEMISQQLTNPERRTRQWFKEITRENRSNERYRVCI